VRVLAVSALVAGCASELELVDDGVSADVELGDVVVLLEVRYRALAEPADDVGRHRA
jgi:hypothetical protein